MSSKPFWVSEREKTLMSMSHRSETDKLQHRIKELEEENSDLKKKVAKMENAFLTAVDLLMNG